MYGPSWSPDGKMLAVASSGKHIYLFDAKSATQLKILPVPSGQQTFISSSSSALTSPQGSTARIFMSALSGGPILAT
ncbi:hypothetical protein EPA93_07965 [Ktedonosporobacter rubrisoli]|uniref:Anaphase-promoting complex subunit 4 WD40 domain-containing protein n=1 Tax=Ktedonosporobacter rubrisoli TaxID=2509675 RepID=A0A4P6K667_KTERU|nr:hypothetical protein EPA93_07965 [Ktedonosporobacter rubrisoli]